MTKWLCLLAVSTFALPLIVSAQLLTQEQKLDDYHQLVQNIRAQYGPYQFKIDSRIVDVPKHIADFETRIANTTGNRDYYETMLEFVAGFKDGHFSIFVPSKQLANVPVGTDLIEGKVLIVKVDREKLPLDKFPFQIGDEIISFNGKPVADELALLTIRVGSGNPATVRRMAAWQLLRRSGARMSMPTDKTVTLEIRRGTTSLTDTAKIDWTVVGKPVDEAMNAAQKSMFSLRVRRPSSLGMINNEPIIALAAIADVDYACSAKTRIAVPADATWILKEPFTAYTYNTAKGKVGYLRIPHYYPQPKPGQSGAAAFEEWFEAYRFAVKKLEATTVGLVIDQDHNCGGSINLVENSAALFINRPFAPMPFSLKATKASFLELQGELANAPAANLEIEAYQKVMTLVEETWKKSPGAMTPKIFITGRDTVPVDPVSNYTKPIVVLIDDVAGSGGDAFPSIMKGEGRARLFGTQTSGLGGSVSPIPELNNTGLRVSLTRTLFFKPDGTPVENNGAVPDKVYEISRDDLLLEFRPYQKAYTDYLLEQVPAPVPPAP